MIKMRVNGAECEIAEGSNLAEALKAWGYKTDMPIAVAVNNTFVPKQDYHQLILTTEHSIEILMPMQGG